MIPMCPLEIFKNGHAGCETKAAAKVQKNVAANEGTPFLHLEKLNHGVTSFLQRSDLLLAYNLYAISSSRK